MDCVPLCVSNLYFTGIVLSGNEISQILLSLFLSYWGGQKNRPRWIAWGVVICGVSCFILALPHFIFGAGEDALRLTQEYIDLQKERAGLMVSVAFVIIINELTYQDN